MKLIFFRPGALQRLTAEEIMLEVRASGDTVVLLARNKSILDFHSHELSIHLIMKTKRFVTYFYYCCFVQYNLITKHHKILMNDAS